jgi:tetratricopeptide (TPR) repeat protein
MPEAFAELVSKADRAVRRGEMSEAVRLYEDALKQNPSDAALATKLDHLRASLQPSELMSGKIPVPEQSGPHLVPMTPEQEGERLFGLGDYAGAAAAYRRALRDKPDSELIKERLFELYRLAQTAPRHSPTDKALPKEKDALLKALLDRISARKKVNVG